MHVLRVCDDMRTEIIDPRRNIALKASAGSGKTFALSLRVVNLLLNGAEPERILCLTFTNKATNEMCRRIISIVRYLAFELSPANLKDEAKYLLLSQRGEQDARDVSACSFSDDEVSDLRKRSGAIYRHAVRNISNLRVSTIDSFLNSILRLFPFEAGIMPDFGVLTPRMNDLVYFDAFERFVRKLDDDPLLRRMISDLIRKSYKAVNSPDTFLRGHFDRLLEMRIGAERVIVNTLACLREDGDVRCVEDISDRLDRASNLDVEIRKDARAFAKTLRENCTDISGRGLGELKKYETSDAASLAGLTSIGKERYDEYSFFRKCGGDKKAHALFDKIKKELPLFIHLKNDVYRDAVLYLFHLFIKELDEVKKRKNGLTFSDVTNTCYRLLVDGGLIGQSPEYFYFRLDSRIDHLLIDEFQDTNFIQWLILKPFVDELTAGIGQRDSQGSFFYVGDPKQSIYRFRGGESRLFDAVLSQYSGRIIPEFLDSNFRSARRVVEFVNRLFTRISMMYPFDYKPQECRRPESEGYVDIVFFDKKGPNGTNVKKKKTLKWIEELNAKGIGPKEVAILCSDNRQCADYAGLLISNGIPAVTEGSLSILSVPAVNAIIELLRYLNDPAQEVYLLGFLFSVPGLLSSKQKRSLLSTYKKPTVPDSLKEKIKLIMGKVNLLPVSIVIRMIVDEFDIFARFDREPNIAFLLDLSASPEFDNTASLGRFLEFAETTLSDIRAAQAGAVNAVKVLTIHKAKGLEFPYVIVPEIEIDMTVTARETPLIFEYDEDLFISDIHLNENEKVRQFHHELTEAVDREKDLAVRDRLNQLYVALTRAQEGLFVTALVKDDKKVNSTLRLSDILFDALGREGYSKGVIPRYPLKLPEQSRKTPGPHLLNEVFDYIIAQRKDSSQLEEKAEEYETVSFDNYRARRLGIAFHYAVQVIREFTEEAVKGAMARVIQIYGSGLSADEIGSVHKRISMLISDAEFRELITEAEINREITFISEGRTAVADFVTVGKNKVTVIDFKTNYEEEMLEKYTKQVSGYCSLASRIYGRACEGYICFVLENKVNYIVV